MSIRLPEDFEPGLTTHDDDSQSIVSYNTKLRRTVYYRIIKYLSQFKIFYIPVLNWGILCVYLSLLYKLIQRYETLYEKSVLLTTMTTNTLLFGLSDTLAQSISCFLALVSERPYSASVSLDNYQPTVSRDQPDDSFYADYGDTRSRQRQNSVQSVNSQFQLLSKQTDKDIFNFHRFLGFTMWGFAMSFVQVAWYWVLNHLFTADPTFVSVLERVLSDQLFFSPISLFSFFTYSNFVLEGGDKITLNDKIQKIYISTLAANYMVWPLVQFINFLVMPRRFQVPFSSSGKCLFHLIKRLY